MSHWPIECSKCGGTYQGLSCHDCGPTPAGRIAVVVEMFAEGLLCSCKHRIVTRDDWDEVEDTTLVHDDDCAGKDTVRKLLGVL